MALVDIIRAGVKIASTTFESVKEDVSYYAFISETGKGVKSYADPVSKRAIVDRATKQKFTSGGVLVTVRATLTFLDPFTISPKDKFVLSDGLTGVTLIAGTDDSATEQPFVPEVEIGEVNQLA